MFSVVPTWPPWRHMQSSNTDFWASNKTSKFCIPQLVQTLRNGPEVTQSAVSGVCIFLNTHVLYKYVLCCAANPHLRSSLSMCFQASNLFISVPGPPRNLSLLSVDYLGNGSSLATVSWLPPMMTLQYFLITGYKLWYKAAPITNDVHTKPHSVVVHLSPVSKIKINSVFLFFIFLFFIFFINFFKMNK